MIVIALDDVGFGQLGCYGSSIRTPAIDPLADDRTAFSEDVYGLYRLTQDFPEPEDLAEAWRSNGPAGPNIAGRTSTVTATPGALPDDGVPLAYGLRAASFTLFAEGCRLVIDLNLVGRHHRVEWARLPRALTVSASRSSRSPMAPDRCC